MTASDNMALIPQPAVDRSNRSGGIGWLFAVALVVIGAAIGFVLIRREGGELYVLIFLGLLAAIGVLALFALSVGLLRMGAKRTGSDLAESFLDSMTEGALVTDASGRVIYANQAYAELTHATDAGVRTIERVFAGEPEAAEPIYRLSQAAAEGRRATEEIRLSAPRSS